ncbi:MAG: aconitate hydratase, partial [Clostridiales bacterium]|nr:aconitate hydratase [Clostridiales bacterium]
MKRLKELAQNNFELDGQKYSYYRMDELQQFGYDIRHLPYCLKVLLEALLRQEDRSTITEEHIHSLANWVKEYQADREIPFKSARVILQDFTGVPAVVDLASLREAMSNRKGDITKINPEIPVDLVIDHSIQVDSYGTSSALKENIQIDFERNQERYRFLNWAQGAFEQFRIVPPSVGIIHQINLEYLASVVTTKQENDQTIVFPDTVVGTDSHTTMINGLGVLGWGVGGIEAEAGMLGQPSYINMPEVVGVRLTGRLSEGVTATDLALTVTQRLRQKGVVNKFVEFFGEGVRRLPLSDRATLANMAPEYGATCGYFPVDEQTILYLKLTGRSEEKIRLAETYLKENGMFYEISSEDPIYTEVVEIDLSKIEASLSGPKRPQDRIEVKTLKQKFVESITAPLGNQGYGLTETEINKQVKIQLNDGRKGTLRTGSVVIAAITSCTNTSNPSVMIGAGLLARNAVKRGLRVPAYVKTSLAPGSKVVTAYLEKSGLQEYLDELGFQTVGYGCTTCIGNSGPLLPEIESAIVKKDLLVASVLSGNRNFEGRIHPLVKANYLASPMLVLAYALAGTVAIDLRTEPIAKDADGNSVFLKDLWPDLEEINQFIEANVKPAMFVEQYQTVYHDNLLWNQIVESQSPRYSFDKASTYIQNPAFFDGLTQETKEIQALKGLRVLAIFKDSVTTDHISPAGAIGKDSPAGRYLLEHGVTPEEFNTYGSRRGNHEVMMRGTFANIRIRNQIAGGKEGGYTTYWPTKEILPIFDACERYK